MGCELRNRCTKADSDQFDALAVPPGLMVRSRDVRPTQIPQPRARRLEPWGRPILLCPMSSPEGATARPLRKLRRRCRCDDRATVGAKPETSVNKLLFAGSRMSVFPSGALPVFERASILRSASKDGREFPLPWLRSRRCTISVFTGPCPGAGSLRDGSNVPLAPFGCPALLGRSTGSGDLATDGPDEAREFPRDCGDGDSLKLAPSD